MEYGPSFFAFFVSVGEEEEDDEEEEDVLRFLFFVVVVVVVDDRNDGRRLFHPKVTHPSPAAQLAINEAKGRNGKAKGSKKESKGRPKKATGTRREHKGTIGSKRKRKVFLS